MPELPQIYNSRIVKSYIHCMNASYPEADIDLILQHAGISKYELDDPGHWFNQQQVDRFFEKTVEVTGNPSQNDADGTEKRSDAAESSEN